MPNTVPQLTNYAANAYNAKDGNFLSKPVFVLTYNNGNHTDWGPNTEIKDIPDQISVSTVTTHYELQRSLLLRNKSDYDRSFSVSVDAEYSGVTYSGSVQSSLLYHGSLFSSTSSFYALNFYLQSVLNFERLPVASSSLDTNFISAITALPTDVSSPANQQSYFDFFDIYGTHYTSFATMGGTMVMETEIENSLLESFSELEVSEAISAGYSGLVNSGSLNVNTAYKKSTFLSEHRNSMHSTLNVMGGLYAPDEKISVWVNTVYKTPSLLLNVPLQDTKLTTLESISKLVSKAGGDSVIANNIESLLHTYMLQDDYKDGLLTYPTEIDFSHVYDTKAGNGFVISTVRETANGDRGYIQAFDSTGPNPTTIRANASQHYYTNHDTVIPFASLTMPTPSGTYFNSKVTPTAGSPNTSLKFVGFGNIEESGMQPWQDIAVNTDLTAETDGFVIAYVDWNNANGSRGYIQGKQKLGVSDSNYTTVAGSSQHYYTSSDTLVPNNSFCMPVRKNTQYRVDFVKTSTNPAAKAFFVSLTDALIFFDAYQQRSVNDVHQAQTDGFLIAYLYSQTNGDRGYVDLYAHADQNELIKLGQIASTSIHYYTNHDTYVPENTAMIPVPKNEFYTAKFTKTSTNPGIQVLWMPLGIQKKA